MDSLLSLAVPEWKQRGKILSSVPGALRDVATEHNKIAHVQKKLSSCQGPVIVVLSELSNDILKGFGGAFAKIWRLD